MEGHHSSLGVSCMAARRISPRDQDSFQQLKTLGLPHWLLLPAIGKNGTLNLQKRKLCLLIKRSRTFSDCHFPSLETRGPEPGVETRLPHHEHTLGMIWNLSGS